MLKIGQNIDREFNFYLSIIRGFAAQKIATFVNLECISQIKDAVFESGGGQIRRYDSCCFIF
jgi:hypothetical protein